MIVAVKKFDNDSKKIKVKAKIASSKSFEHEFGLSHSVIFKNGEVTVPDSLLIKSHEIYFLKAPIHKSADEIVIDEILEKIQAFQKENDIEDYFEKEIVSLITELSDAINKIESEDIRHQNYLKIKNILETYITKKTQLEEAKLIGKPFLTLEPENILLLNCESALKNLKKEITLYLCITNNEKIYEDLDEDNTRKRLNSHH